MSSSPSAALDLRAHVMAAALQLSRSTPAVATVEDAIRAAKLPADSLPALWPDPAQFEFDLLAALLDEVRDSVAKTTLGMKAGLPRLQLAIETYLEANLARPAVRKLALRLQARAAGAAILRSRVAGFTLMMEMELKTLKWPHAAATARLFTAALLEIAYAEHEAERALPELRDHVSRYFEGGHA